jgi:hypothetical protein
MMLLENNRMTFAKAVLGFALILCLPSQVVASLVVSSWSLLTFTEDSSVDLPLSDSVRFTEVQSPFQAVGNAAVGPNTATTSYDFSWSGDTGSFDITTAQRAETFRVFTISSGFIFISPTTDLRMTIDASLDYASPPGDLANVRFRMLVRDGIDQTVPFFFFESLLGGNLSLEPAAGTLAFSGDVILPAGTTYLISFAASNDNGADNNPTGPITSSGFIHFAFQPVPEPATAWLITLGAIAVRRARRKCR